MTHTDIAETIQVLRDLFKDGFPEAALVGLETLQRDVEALATQPEQAKGGDIQYTPGTWYEVKSHDELEAFFLSRLPSIREAAKDHGYAIGLHGSLRRDMDLIAVPWRDGASDKDTLAHAIAMAAVGMTRNGAYRWEQKPAGRVATSLSCAWTPWSDVPGSGHIDLSVMQAPAPAASVSDEDIDKLHDSLFPPPAFESARVEVRKFARAILALRPAQAGVQHFGWAYDFLDGVRIVNDWVTSSKDEAFKPGHFNQRELLAAASTKEGGAA